MIEHRRRGAGRVPPAGEFALPIAAAGSAADASREEDPSLLRPAPGARQFAIRPWALRAGRGLAAVGSRAGRVAADLLAPPVCAACQRRIGTPEALCPTCWAEVGFISVPRCDVLGIPLRYAPAGESGRALVSAAAVADPPDYDRARAATVFGAVVKRLVHTFKYHDQHHARRLFSRWMVAAGRDVLADADVLVPVPLHPWRLIARRFNQSAILATEIARETGLPIDAVSLVRVKRTPQQAQLSAIERRANMQGAFKVPKRLAGRVAGRRIVLVEDVITTGATVNACARALKSAGAARVDVLAIAIAVVE